MTRLPRCLTLAVCLGAGAVAALAQQGTPAIAPALRIDGLGKGTATLDGPWQFHLGDNPAWALPQTPDATGVAGWEQLSPGKTWGAQGHPSYVGFAWYRKHVALRLAPGVAPGIALGIQHIDDVYEIYWNGRLVGRYGTMPPNPSYPYESIGQTFGLGPVRDGVFALRVWKAPLMSFDPSDLGGLHSAPLVGSPAAIAAAKTDLDYSWLRGRQYFFAMRSLYALVAFLSLLAWFRDRRQKVLLAIAAFGFAPVVNMLLTSLQLPFSYNFALGWVQPVLSIQDIGLWFLLLYLLKLDENPRLFRFTRLLAIISLTATSLDGALTMLDWSKPWVSGWVQGADAVLTVIFTVAEAYPLLLVGFGIRKRLDSARWLLAIAAFVTEMLSVVRIAVQQGSRFTHWTFGNRIAQPLFYLNGIGFTPQILADTLLLMAIIYAVYRYMQETLRRQGALEQEFKSARELQQVLIPETLPELQGYAVTSAYRPALEVGGDFFQIIPLEGSGAGATLIVLGDVSGKGLRAAMTVSLIVGTLRTLAKFESRPSELLAELNLRLCGRMQGGFATCLALRLERDGACAMASAGHPAPYLNHTEIELPGALPLGVVPGTRYQETSIVLREGDHFALYTDGLLEARNLSGEIFSFERLHALFARNPNAAEATEEAVHFGQDDDITVLTLTRLATGQQSTTTMTTPVLASV
jgi:serine phosphatase RsbU (regulator of sigma subunit)